MYPTMNPPFDRILMDIVGPLAGTDTGYRFILLIVDYATRCPEAVSMRSLSAESVANELVKLFSCVGIPREILTDQGTAIMSQCIQQLCGSLKIHSIRTSVYHPQCDGLVERFNKTKTNAAPIRQKGSK